MSDTEIKRAYQRGYDAGRRKHKADVRQRGIAQQREEFRRKAFLAALPFVMSQETWALDGKKIRSTEERLDFAARIATRALKHF